MKKSIQMAQSVMKFHRRPLPANCIDFSSELGDNLFFEALKNGHGRIFTKLISQYKTQSEPAYCGLTTLVMVLNALEVDPGRVWKGSWKWYHEEFLDCCRSMADIKESGINMQEFVCLAKCNRLNVALHSTNRSSDVSINAFRDHVIASVSSKHEILVVSYDRGVLGQTGTGHFSPIGAFHQDSDRLLVLDVARFKYPPHWVPLPLLYDAMRSVDPSTGKPRGYVLITSDTSVKNLVAFKLGYSFYSCNKKWSLPDVFPLNFQGSLMELFVHFLRKITQLDEPDNLLERLIDFRLPMKFELLNGHENEFAVKFPKDIPVEQSNIARTLIDQLKNTSFFRYCLLEQTLNPELSLRVTMLFFIFPLANSSFDLERNAAVDGFADILKNEITILRNQISNLPVMCDLLQCPSAGEFGDAKI